LRAHPFGQNQFGIYHKKKIQYVLKKAQEDQGYTSTGSEEAISWKALVSSLCMDFNVLALLDKMIQ